MAAVLRVESTFVRNLSPRLAEMKTAFFRQCEPEVVEGREDRWEGR